MASSKKKEGQQWQDEEVLQAVVLADSFNQRFVPLTAHEPRTLLPLLNTPLLDYTLEFLTAAGVQDIILFCCAHSAIILRHIAQSKWAKIVKHIVSQKCMSVGDALREVDQSGLIRHNFVLVTGDIVSNYKMGVLSEHKARLKADKDAVMTMLFKCAKPGHPLRSAEDNLVVALDGESGRLLSFDNSNKRRSTVTMAAFQDRTSVQIRADLVNCHVFLCAPQLLMLFSDNFDYQTIEDFIIGTLIADDLEQFKIYAHVLVHEYAARVNNFYSYQAISKDILGRWAYPLVPDVFSSSISTVTRYTHNHVYLEDGVILSRACKLSRSVLVGAGTRVGRDGAAVTNISWSVVGRNCTIGTGVELQDTYVWDNVSISDGCRISNALIASGVKIGANVNISGGTVVGHGVQIPDGVTVPPGSRLALERPPGVVVDRTAETKYFQWPLLPSDPDYCFKLWDRPVLEEFEESDSEDEDAAGGVGENRDDFAQHVDDMRDLFSAHVRGGKPLSTELKDNLIMEIKASKHAHHVSLADTVRAITTALAAEVDDHKDSLKKMTITLLPVLASFAKEKECQTHILLGFEDAIALRIGLLPGLMAAIHALYENDVLEEDMILAWHANQNSTLVKPQIVKAVQSLITWLQTAEEESEEGDDDDEEDSD